MSDFWDELTQVFSNWDFSQDFSRWYERWPAIRGPEIDVIFAGLVVGLGESGGIDSFTGNATADPFTAVAGSTGNGTADPFITMADEVPNAGSGQVVDPFAAPGPDDKSQLLASGGSQSPQSNQWVVTPGGLQIQLPSQLVLPGAPSVSDVPASFGDSQQQPVASENTGPKLGQAAPWPPAQLVTSSPPANSSAAPSTVSTVTAPAASAYDSPVVQTPPPSPTAFVPQGPELNVLHLPEITIYGETEAQVAADLQDKLGVDPYALARAYGPVSMHELYGRLEDAHFFDQTDPSSQHNQVFDEISELSPYGVGPRNRPVMGTEWQVAQLRATGQQAIDQEFVHGVLTGAGGLQVGAATSGVGGPFGGSAFDYPALGTELATTRRRGSRIYARFLRESADPRLALLKKNLLNPSGNFKSGWGETLEELRDFSDRVQMGHMFSLGGGGSIVVIQDAYINQWDANMIESSGQFMQRIAVNIFGLPFERDTAMMYESRVWLGAGTVRYAPVIDLGETF